MGIEAEFKKDMESIYGTIRQVLEKIGEDRNQRKDEKYPGVLETMENKLADAAAILQKDIFTCDTRMTREKTDSGEENRWTRRM